MIISISQDIPPLGLYLNFIAVDDEAVLDVAVGIGIAVFDSLVGRTHDAAFISGIQRVGISLVGIIYRHIGIVTSAHNLFIDIDGFVQLHVQRAGISHTTHVTATVE